MAIKLGTEVTDKYTGFKGLAHTRATFLSGCVKIGIQPKELKDGIRPDIDFFNEKELVEYDGKSVEPHFLMGKMATDSISGFKGIVVAYLEYRYSEPRLSLQPKTLSKEGLPVLAQDFDESQIKEVIAARKAKKVPAKKVPGGPAPSAASARRRDSMPSR